MITTKTKTSLTALRRRLLETMQQLNFGRIELEIRNGEPVFQPSPRLIQDIKIGSGENGPRAELASEDFALKSQVVEMFDHLSGLSDGSAVVIHVAHGLPFRLTVEQPM